jgi:hypothetical protein
MDLTEALRVADKTVKLDCLRACRHGIRVSDRYLTAFGEIDLNRAFT